MSQRTVSLAQGGDTAWYPDAKTWEDGVGGVGIIYLKGICFNASQWMSSLLDFTISLEEWLLLRCWLCPQTSNLRDLIFKYLLSSPLPGKTFLLSKHPHLIQPYPPLLSIE